MDDAHRKIVSALRKGHPILGPDAVDTAAADLIEHLLYRIAELEKTVEIYRDVMAAEPAAKRAVIT